MIDFITLKTGALKSYIPLHKESSNKIKKAKR